jgi:membrane protease YdiL (CAAX protease family)
MIPIDLWKNRDFGIKDGALLCLFLLGILVPVDVLLYLFRINLDVLHDAIFLGMVILIARRFGKNELPVIMHWRKVPAAALCSLLVMFSGIQILLIEASRVLQFIIPTPEGFFSGSSGGNLVLTALSEAVFPALSEELFFRGILLRRLRRRYTDRRALVYSALLFAIMHINPWQTMPTFVGGLFLGWIYIKFKTIWPCMLFHAYNNMVAAFLPFPAAYPLLFVVLGAALFVSGWGLTMAMSGEGGIYEQGAGQKIISD